MVSLEDETFQHLRYLCIEADPLQEWHLFLMKCRMPPSAITHPQQQRVPQDTQSDGWRVSRSSHANVDAGLFDLSTGPQRVPGQLDHRPEDDTFPGLAETIATGNPRSGDQENWA
jgi:hypothetical protein